MKYYEVAEAKDMGGLRLVLTAMVPGPWGESAKKILDYKQIPYIPVAQHAGKENEDLVAWTGIRNAPNAMYEDEAPRTGWYDILMLAERLAPERPLLPARSEERAEVLGICAEICGEWGFGWARRAMMGTVHAGPVDPLRAAGLSKPFFGPEDSARMRKAYRASVGGAAEAPRALRGHPAHAGRAASPAKGGGVALPRGLRPDGLRLLLDGVLHGARTPAARSQSDARLDAHELRHDRPGA